MQHELCEGVIAIECVAPASDVNSRCEGIHQHSNIVCIILRRRINSWDLDEMDTLWLWEDTLTVATALQ